MLPKVSALQKPEQTQCTLWAMGQQHTVLHRGTQILPDMEEEIEDYREKPHLGQKPRL